MRLLVGTDNGLLKVLDCNKRVVDFALGTQKINTGIDFLVPFPAASSSASDSIVDSESKKAGLDRILAASVDGVVRCWDLGIRSAVSEMIVGDTIVGLEVLPENKILTGTRGGRIQLAPESLLSDPSAGITAHSHTLAGAESFLLRDPKLAVHWLERLRLQPGDGSSAVAPKFAVGGKGWDLELWDLERQDRIWKAENVATNHVDIKSPLWVTDIQFADPNQILVATKFHQFRVYDIRADRHRPVINYPFPELSAFQSLAVRPNSNEVVIGDAVGNLMQLDFRKGQLPLKIQKAEVKDKRLIRSVRGNSNPEKHKGKKGGQAAMSCIYKGPGASLRSIVNLPPIDKISNGLATGGLDRFVYLYDDRKKKSAARIYVKQRITSLLVLPGLETQIKQEEGLVKGEDDLLAIKVESDDDDDANPDEERLWNSLSVVKEEDDGDVFADYQQVFDDDDDEDGDEDSDDSDDDDSDDEDDDSDSDAPKGAQKRKAPQGKGASNRGGHAARGSARGGARGGRGAKRMKTGPKRH
eukprot:TRINITY_DN2680_c0_g1_i1.p1 TRINITY_DN2680_c0_g1~~TRINITY_DN2680_c0_g1_i1.p1  ORF type:complete len:527 (-),score=225.42 TRINITY_DN2680_c0_g1_i1:81-1661(-)